MHTQFNLYNALTIRGSFDVSEFNQILWNTSRGRIGIFNDKIDTEGILNHTTYYYLKYHWYFILLPISLLYRVLPHISSFILSHAFLVGMSIVGFYLVAREMLTEKRFLPFVLVLLYMRYFPLTCVSRFLFPIEFSMVFIFFAFYYYLKDKIAPTLLFSVLAILCREENALIIAVWGIAAYLQPPKRKFCLPFLSLGITLFMVAMLINAKRSDVSHYGYALGFESYYGYLGETFFDKAKNIVLNPSLVFNNITRVDRMVFFKGVFGPVLYLPFLSPLLFLPACVALAEFMLVRASLLGDLFQQPWYASLLIPFIFIALVGFFEKMYRFSTYVMNVFPRYRLPDKKKFILFTTVVACITLCFLLVNIFVKNADLTQGYDNYYRKFFSRKHYWYADTFGVMSAIGENAKVVCRMKFMPMLSSREFILPLRFLTEEIAASKAYDIIIVSEDIWIADLTAFDFMEKIPSYQKIYTTPYLKIFTRNDMPISALIDNWKFDLIAKLKNKTVNHHYIFSNITDYESILKNADVSDASKLVADFYQNTELHYATLDTIQQSRHGSDRIFLSEKPLSAHDKYFLAFAAKAKRQYGLVTVKFPSDKKTEFTRVKTDDQWRLFVIPFTVDQLQKATYSMRFSSSSFRDPVLLRFPADDPSDYDWKKEPVLRVSVDGYTLSYDPQITHTKSVAHKNESVEFLVKHPKFPHNPLIFLMKLCKVTIPADLYTYSWKENRKETDEIIAVRYK